MGLFSSACSIVEGFVSSACSAIRSVCSSIGGAIFGGVSSLASGLVSSIVGTTLPKILLGIQVIGAIVSTIAEILGLKKQEETPEEIGMKAEQCDVKPENFDSIQEYIEHLRENVQIDKEKLNTLSNDDKIKYAAIGSALYIKGIEEKYRMEMPVEFWTTVADMNITGEEVKVYIDNFKEHKIENMKDMTDYIKNDLEDGKDRDKISDAILDSIKDINTGIGEDDLYSELNNLGLD